MDSKSRSSEYDDPLDYREWCDWSDVEDDEGYCDPFRSDVVEAIVASGCASRIVADDAGVAAVVCPVTPVQLGASDGPGPSGNTESWPGHMGPELGDMLYL